MTEDRSVGGQRIDVGRRFRGTTITRKTVNALRVQHQQHNIRTRGHKKPPYNFVRADSL